jgi:hypothetical protein
MPMVGGALFGAMSTTSFFVHASKTAAHIDASAPSLETRFAEEARTEPWASDVEDAFDHATFELEWVECRSSVCDARVRWHSDEADAFFVITTRDSGASLDATR